MSKGYKKHTGEPSVGTGLRKGPQHSYINPLQGTDFQADFLALQ